MAKKKVLNKEVEPSVKDVVKQIKRIAYLIDKEPGQVTLRDCSENGLSERQIRKYGGLGVIKKANFPDVEKQLGDIKDQKDSTKYVTKLENELASKQVFEKLMSQVVEQIKPLPKIKFKKANKVKNNEMIEVVGMLNDTHIGLIVDGEEIGGINSFDFTEACRRFALYAKQLGEYKDHKRSQVTKLRLVLNGDLIAGIIHGLETKTIHLLIHQFNAAVHIFAHTISYLATKYSSIEVECIPGNHCRVIHKDGGARPVAEVYDSYSNMVFYALSAAFKNSKEIKFNVPKTAYGFMDLPAGRCMYAHGDHIFSKALGNPGSSINVKGLSNAIRDFNAGEISKGLKPIKLLLLAHVHTFAHFMTADGVEVYIAPSLVGLDQFAHSLTINNSFTGQVVFESTKNFILGDSRLIRLNEADKDKSLDTIIPVYKKELKWSKNDT